MREENFSRPLDLKKVKITDEFWGREQELVRTEVIPYQWEALNDRIPEAAPSYCMRNFRVAGRLMKEKRERGAAFVEPAYTFRGFEALPQDPEHPEPDKFYGFVFQDSDFAKWIEAVGYSLIRHPDPELEKIADEAIETVCAAQAENGYLDTYYIINGMDRIFTNLRDHHELYCFGHLAEGAISYYQATGKDRLLEAVKRYADFIAEKFGPEEGKCKGYPGHEIAEMALARLYEVTGERKYLELGRFFLDMRGRRPYYFDLEEEERAAHEGRPYRKPGGEPRFMYHQAHLPVREQSEAVGHAVRAVYLYSGMADVARLTGDEALYDACVRLWESIVREKLYITGGIGGTHVGEAFSFPYDLPNDTAYSETCAAIGLVFFARRMLQICADSRYGDVMEQALYNTVLAGMALDGKSFFYVNPLEVVPEACRKDERRHHVKPVRQKWFGCACCPPNLARIVSSVGAYAYTQSADTLYTHLYVGSVISLEMGGRTVEVKLDSRFPWEGEVKALILVAKEGADTSRNTPDGGSGGTGPDSEPGGGSGGTGPDSEPGGRSGGIGPDSESDGTGRGERREVCGTFAFRIPGWCRTAEVEICRRREVCGAMDQEETAGCVKYRINRDAQGVMTEAAVKKALSGAPVQLQMRVEKGYLYLTGRWQDGDEICLNFPMKVRCVSADTRVRENIGRAAFVRGPVCFCMEEIDNGGDLSLLRADLRRFLQSGEAGQASETAGGDTDDASLSETSRELGHEMRILKIPGFRQAPVSYGESLYGDCRPVSEEETTLTFVPYYAWNNRGEGEMSVWVRV